MSKVRLAQQDNSIENRLLLLQGDAQDKLDDIESGIVDCIFTSPDPPESESDLFKLRFIFEKAKRVLKPNGCIWLHMGDFHNQEGTLEQMPQRLCLDMTDKLGYLKRSEIIWQRPRKPKDAMKERQDSNRFLRTYDYLFWFTQSKSGYYFQSNSLFSLSSLIIESCEIQAPGVFESGFPRSIIASILSITCPPGGTVMDCFAGTGTTGLVALKNGFKFIGIDKDEKVISMIEKRLLKNNA